MMKVLFVCVHNSGRSQLAEAFLNFHGKGLVETDSAGLEPGTLNPFVVEVLAERGIDISAKQTKNVVDLYNAGKTYDYVITVCSRDVEKKCPIFPGMSNRLVWSFEDPSLYTGTDEEIRAKVRDLAGRIEIKIQAFLTALVF